MPDRKGVAGEIGEELLWQSEITACRSCEEGVEPINNAAERTIRSVVIWLRTSFGSNSATGSEVVSHLLTVVSSLIFQERNTLKFLSESVDAKCSGQVPPSLIPYPLNKIISPHHINH